MACLGSEPASSNPELLGSGETGDSLPFVGDVDMMERLKILDDKREKERAREMKGKNLAKPKRKNTKADV